jgi:FAD/FMN-containing dehydrogenase
MTTAREFYREPYVIIPTPASTWWAGCRVGTGIIYVWADGRVRGLYNIPVDRLHTVIERIENINPKLEWSYRWIVGDIPGVEFADEGATIQRVPEVV